MTEKDKVYVSVYYIFTLFFFQMNLIKILKENIHDGIFSVTHDMKYIFVFI